MIRVGVNIQVKQAEVWQGYRGTPGWPEAMQQGLAQVLEHVASALTQADHQGRQQISFRLNLEENLFRPALHAARSGKVHRQQGGGASA